MVHFSARRCPCKKHPKSLTQVDLFLTVVMRALNVRSSYYRVTTKPESHSNSAVRGIEDLVKEGLVDGQHGCTNNPNREGIQIQAHGHGVDTTPYSKTFPHSSENQRRCTPTGMKNISHENIVSEYLPIIRRLGVEARAPVAWFYRRSCS